MKQLNDHINLMNMTQIWIKNTLCVEFVWNDFKYLAWLVSLLLIFQCHPSFALVTKWIHASLEFFITQNRYIVKQNNIKLASQPMMELVVVPWYMFDVILEVYRYKGRVKLVWFCCYLFLIAFLLLISLNLNVEHLVRHSWEGYTGWRPGCKEFPYIRKQYSFCSPFHDWLQHCWRQLDWSPFWKVQENSQENVILPTRSRLFVSFANRKIIPRNPSSKSVLCFSPLKSGS